MEKALISRDTFDKAATEVKTASASRRSADFKVDVANYELQAAKTALEYAARMPSEETERVPIHAPISGKVLKVAHECEGPVRTGVTGLTGS